MNSYQYVLSLRLRHPTHDLAAASDRLGLVPKWVRASGAPRATPNGDTLDGLYRESYWCAELLGGVKYDSSEQSLESALALVHEQLLSHRDYLAQLRRDGGSAECFVGLFASGNFGFELPPELLESLGTLGVRISVDAYP